MKCKFELGQQVVCINNDWRAPRGETLPARVPVLNEVYTVSDIIPTDGPVDCRSGVWIRLEGMGTCRFCSDHFRPAKPTDLKQLTRLLDVSPEDKLELEQFDHILGQLADDGLLRRGVLVSLILCALVSLVPVNAEARAHPRTDGRIESGVPLRLLGAPSFICDEIPGVYS